MKKLIILFMMIISTLSFAGKKLYVGTNAEFKPYEYLEGDKITGFDIDFMDAIGKEIGYEVHWVNMGFDGLLPALQMKKVDAVIAGMSQTLERQKAVDFSMPYMFTKSEHYVIVNENSTIVKKEELKDKKVGVQIGTIQEEFTIALGGIPQIYNAWTGALMDLQQDKISGMLSQKPAKDVSLDIQRMNALLRTYGIETDSPITRPSTLALIVIPEVKMSDLGLIDVVNQKVIKQF